MSGIIEVDNLVKTYPGGTRAVDGISFEVKEGEFFGFLGPNGAGKSTTIRMLTTLLEKTSGTAVIAGHDLDREQKEIRRIIGTQSQDTAIDGDLTGRDNLLLQGHLQRMRGEELDRRADELLGLLGLSDVAEKKAMYYSSGMKKKLDLATALVHKPRLVFLDEPTIGLDLQSRGRIWTYLKGLNGEGVTIFLTTQYLEEADRLCDRVSIIDQGRIIVTGSPRDLKQQVGGDRVTVRLDGTKDDIRKAEETAKELGGVTVVQRIDESLILLTNDGSRAIPEVVKALDGHGISPVSVSLQTPSLDDVFLQHTGRSIRPEPLVKSRRKRRMPFH